MDQITVCCWGCSVHFRVFSGVCGLCPLDSSSDNPKCLQVLSNVLRGWVVGREFPKLRIAIQTNLYNSHGNIIIINTSYCVPFPLHKRKLGSKLWWLPTCTEVIFTKGCSQDDPLWCREKLSNFSVTFISNILIYSFKFLTFIYDIFVYNKIYDKR